MTQVIETTESWLDQLLHPGKIPPEALAGGMTPELAWEHWAEDRAAERAGKARSGRQLSSAERWWYARFDRGWQQEHGAELGRTDSKADRQAQDRAAELEAGS